MGVKVRQRIRKLFRNASKNFISVSSTYVITSELLRPLFDCLLSTLAPSAFLSDLIEETGPDAKFLLFSQNNPSLYTNNEVQSFEKLTADSGFPPPKAFVQTLYDIVLSLKYTCLGRKNLLRNFEKLINDSNFSPTKAFCQTLHDILLLSKYPFLEPQVTCWSLVPAYSILIVKYRKKHYVFLNL
jgi:hypothetical protein